MLSKIIFVTGKIDLQVTKKEFVNKLTGVGQMVSKYIQDNINLYPIALPKFVKGALLAQREDEKKKAYINRIQFNELDGANSLILTKTGDKSVQFLNTNINTSVNMDENDDEQIYY